MKNYTVIKRNGTIENFNFDKIYKHMQFACEGLSIDPSELASRFKIRLSENMKSEDIQKSLIYAAADMISDENPDAQYVASRLLLQDIYKTVHGKFDPKFNYDILKERINKGFYDSSILDKYTPDEINELAEVIDNKNDLKFTYLGLNQMTKKYGIKIDGKLVETPQEIYFLIALYNFMNIEDKKEREYYVTNFYKALANFDIFLSTPPMAGIRTPMKGWTSCAGVHLGDSIEEFGNAAQAIFKLITKLRAGIGANPGLIRGMGADIGDGLEIHTGIIPYLKVFEAISRSSQQPNSGRTGAITNYYPFFHWEIEKVLEAKNNKGSDESSVRFSDHAIIFNDLFYERVKKNKNISLFHMNEVPELFDHIGKDDFKELYEKYEKDDSIKKLKINARMLYRKYLYERYSTARIYKVNANEFQKHSAYKNIPVTMSNLCTEIENPAFPIKDFELTVKDKNEFNNFIDKLRDTESSWYQLYRYLYYEILDDKNKKIVQEFEKYLDPNGEKVTLNFGEIFSCILGGINFGNLPPFNETRRRNFFNKNLNLLIRFLDEMIDNQDYQNIEPFEKFTKNRRALGISPGNYFYFLAKVGTDYDSQDARDLTHKVFEEFAYYAYKNSCELAKKKGACEWFNDTYAASGILPIDTYNRNVDELVDEYLKLDWDSLRDEIKEYGLRNSTLLTAVPSSNSSRPANMISGINPPQSLTYNVEDQKIKVSGVLPNVKKYKKFYEKHLSWNIDIIEYWKLVAIMQKFIDQSISLNEYVDFTKFPDGKIPYDEAVKRDLFTVKYGLKTLYYAKTRTSVDENDDQEEATGCSGGGCTL